jgi:hypothetical protein
MIKALACKKTMGLKPSHPGDLKGRNMLYELKALTGSPVVATDGELGSVRTFLFDDQSWKVR